MPSVLELIKDFKVTQFTNYSPGVYWSTPSFFTLADYWINIFGAPDQSSGLRIFIRTLRVDGSSSYASVNSIEECEASDKTFYWDVVNQKLYYHLPIDVDPLFSNVTYGSVYGFTSGETLYLDDQEYLPIIQDVPSVKQSEDLVDYDLLDFISGSFVFNNSNEDLDFIINENVIGNDAFFYHIPKGKYERSDLIPLGSYNVNDYSISEFICNLDVADKRLAGNIEIPTEKFSKDNYPDLDEEIDGDIIPLMFGKIRECGVIVVNSESLTGNVECVIAQELTSLGQVQYEDDGLWINITPDIQDLENGYISLNGNKLFVEGANVTDNGSGKVRINKTSEFVGIEVGESIRCAFPSIYEDKIYKINDIDSSNNYIDINLDYTFNVSGIECEVYSDARNDNGSIRNIKVVGPTGVLISKTTDIIVWLAERYENAFFDSQSFDIDSWNEVSFYLSSGSYMINDKINLYDAYKAVQEGSTYRFRYDYTPEGKRTLKLNDENLIVSGNIYHQDFDEIEVVSDSDVIFSEVEVSYDKNYYSGKYYKTENADNKSTVIDTFRRSKILPVTSLLNNKDDADFRAESDSNRFSVAPETVVLSLKGKEYIDLKIYDVFNVELTKGFVNLDDESIKGRVFYGLRRCQVIGVDPDSENAINNVTFKVLGKANFRDQLIYDDGTMMIFDNGDTMTNDGVS